MPIKQSWKALLFLIFFIGNAPLVEAQRVRNYINADSLQVGDTFTYTLVSRHRNPNEQMLLPDSSAFGDFIKILDTKHFKLDPAGDSVIYTLQFFGLNDTLISNIDVPIITADADTQYFLAASAPLFFKTVLPDTNAEFKPYKPIFEFANWLLALLLIAGLLAALGLWWWYKQQKNKPQPVQEAPPVFEAIGFSDPIVQLEKDVYQLRHDAQQRFETDTKLAYTQLADAFRTYFERVYGFPALEQSSNEILRTLKGLILEPRSLGQIARLLRDADMVKFAKFSPDEATWKDHLADAAELVERFKREDMARIDALKASHLEAEQKRKEAFEAQLKANKEEEELETEPKVLSADEQDEPTTDAPDSQASNRTNKEENR